MKVHRLLLIPLGALALLCFGALAADPPAARHVLAEIAVDGAVVLRASTSDDGHADADAVWGYLRDLRFQPLDAFAALGIADDASEASIVRKAQPTAITIDIPYGGLAHTWQLLLVRAAPDTAGARLWQVDPADIDRHFSRRSIRRDQAARLEDPRREK